jgi:hypothetical protein
MAAVRIADNRPNLTFARHFLPQPAPSWLSINYIETPSSHGLSLISLPGPRDNQLCDFGVWSEPVSLVRPERYFANSQDYETAELIYDREVRVYELKRAMPRVGWSVTLDPRISAEWSSWPKWWNISRPAVEGIDKLEQLGAKVSISNIEEGGGLFTFQVRIMKGRGFLVISNLFYPGWRAYVNGEEQRIYRVNGVMQGLFVGPGESKVRIVYHSPVHRISLWMRWSAWAVFLTALVYLGLRRPSI